MKLLFAGLTPLIWLIGLFLLSFAGPPWQFVGLGIFLASVVYAFIEPRKRHTTKRSSSSHYVADAESATMAASDEINDQEESDRPFGRFFERIQDVYRSIETPHELRAPAFTFSSSTASFTRREAKPPILPSFVYGLLQKTGKDMWTVADPKDTSDKGQPRVRESVSAQIVH